MSIVRVPLTKGFTTIIDAEDAELVLRFRWCATVNRSANSERAYAMRAVLKSEGGGFQRLHNLLMNPSPGSEVDHINKDTLDNRRANLRIVNRSLNNANRRYANKTGYRGVRRQKSGFSAMFLGKHLGMFATAEEAARAWDAKAAATYGDCASLNFPVVVGTDIYSVQDALREQGVVLTAWRRATPVEPL